MLTLADLDSTDGLRAFRQACADCSACLRSLRFFTRRINTGDSLRNVLADMVALPRTVEDDDPVNWAMWAFDELSGLADDGFRLHLLTVAALEPAEAAMLDLHRDDLTPAMRRHLRGLWHSGSRADGAVVLPRVEEEIAAGIVTMVALDG